VNRIMKRVALLVHSANWSGYEQDLYELLIRWNRSPAPTVYLTEEGILGDKLREHGIAVRVLPMDAYKRGSSNREQRYLGIMGTLRYAKRLSQDFKRDQIECVHANTNTLYTIVYGSIAAKWAHLPLIWYVQKSVAAPYLNQTTATMLRIFFRYIPDGIMVNSLSTLASLKLPRQKMSRVQLIYPAYSGVYGRMIGVSPDPAYITVLLVGRLAEWKGQHLLLAAAKAFLPDRKIRFWLVGAEQNEESVYREMLQYQIRNNGLTNITVLGYVENLKSIIHQADILLYLNMNPEPLNQVILQAMAAGIPIIASNIGGPMEVIKDGETGILFPPGDTGALRRSIRSMINHPEEREEMGLKGMARIKSYFAIELSLQRIMDFYE
jgi:glycosyltransferase involved in cell wall biosynthesis